MALQYSNLLLYEEEKKGAKPSGKGTIQKSGTEKKEENFIILAKETKIHCSVKRKEDRSERNVSGGKRVERRSLLRPWDRDITASPEKGKRTIKTRRDKRAYQGKAYNPRRNHHGRGLGKGKYALAHKERKEHTPHHRRKDKKRGKPQKFSLRRERSRQ